MNLVGRLRRLRWLRRATLAAIALLSLQSALLPCAMSAQMDSGISEHCAYCPGDMQSSDRDSGSTNGCHFLHAPTIDSATYSQHAVTQADVPLLQRAFRQPVARAAASSASIEIPRRPPARPLTLTHCVQLK